MKNELLIALEVHNWPFDKQRLGRNADGGYIICDIPNIEYDLFLSGGVGKDISFEEDFLQKYPKVPCYAFDPGCKKLPQRVPGVDTIYAEMINVVTKKIGKHEKGNETNLINYLCSYKNVFVKLDIEGGEYNLWEALTDEHMNKIAQLVIEIHPTDFSVFKSFILKTHKTHELFHVHCNNVVSLADYSYDIDGIPIPMLIELTYVRKDLLNFSLEKNKSPLPSSLDKPNMAHLKDISLNYYPFVNE